MLVLVLSVLALRGVCGEYVSNYQDTSQSIAVSLGCTVDDSETTLSCVLTARAIGWLAFGYCPQQTMSGTSAYIATPANNKIAWYEITDSSVSGLGNPYTLASGTTGSWMQNSTHTVLSISQPYVTNVASTTAIPADKNGNTQLAYAIGISNGLTDDGHQQYGIFDIGFLTGKVEELPITHTDAWKIVHAGMMIFCWSFLFPLSMQIPRLLRDALRKTLGLKSITTHRNLQVVGFFLAVGAFVLALKNVSSHFKGAHGILGLIVICFLTMQVLLAFLVPTFKLAHRVLGYSMFIASTVGIYLGMQFVKEDVDLHRALLISAVFGYVINALVLLSGCYFLKQSQQSDPRETKSLLGP
eukprot:TRINITY_DN15061_c0_g1_i1.p1 TRINITY_DN15061_c0_g1~~TRINITY_DN15061_c0_g1_i1.p1  ORF type:complete len:356 (-),score=56.52 TRINITY_DN15061_c0_g1_i1:49-1116(-)